MINWFLRRKTANIESRPLELVEIQQAHKVLFALFTRYGDTIIDLVVIQEFIEQYPDKEYLILCPRQMVPYVNELLPGVRYVALNKRNLLDMIKADRLLKQWKPDIGFNPWSNGLDSCYFLTYCKRYYCYKEFVKPEVINHYEVVRCYFRLAETDWQVNQFKPEGSYRKILICPQSTDPERSISQSKLSQLITNLKQFHQESTITIAAMDQTYFQNGCSSFIFNKSAESSQNFIDLIKGSDLVISSDSGPLHIASALAKELCVAFYITKPALVLNTGAKICHVQDLFYSRENQ